MLSLPAPVDCQGPVPFLHRDLTISSMISGIMLFNYRLVSILEDATDVKFFFFFFVSVGTNLSLCRSMLLLLFNLTFPLML